MTAEMTNTQAGFFGLAIGIPEAIAILLSGASLGVSVFSKATDKSAREICACLEVVNGSIAEIAATLKDGFSGRNVDVGGINRRLGKPQIEVLGVSTAIRKIEKSLAQIEKNRDKKTQTPGPKIKGGRTHEDNLKDELKELKDRELFLNNQIEALKETRNFLEKESAPGIGAFNPAALTEPNKLLGDLTATIGAEDGLLGSFRDLDAALKDGGLLGALAGLAEAVEIAAARIADAVNAPSSGSLDGKASGGTVTAGQPVLVGERGPEIFIPGSAGSIVNAFDAAAGEGTSMGAGGGPGASGQTAVEREIIATLKELDATLADLDESIRQAEDAGILGSSTRGRSSSSRRFGTSGSAKDPLAQIDEALRLVESTGGAFEDMGRVLQQLKRQGEDSFEGIALAADEAFASIMGSIQTIVGNIFGGKAGWVRGAPVMPGGASDDRPMGRRITRNECSEWEGLKLAA